MNQLAIVALLATITTPLLADRRADVARDAAALKPKLVECRRDLHMHPELSNREERTSQQIAARLTAIGVPFERGIAKHGIVASIKGGKPGKTIAFRADIDALPVNETIDVPYKSKTPNVKHACGHDLHTTVALGMTELLWKRRASLPGTVHVIFQPAEEGPPPGEAGGAPLMIKEGLLDRLKPVAMFALHSHPGLEAGTAGWTPGAEMASSDRFKITITGKQSHGAQPHLGIDSITAASQVVLALQTIDSRRIDPLQPIVVTVGSFHAGSRFNIVAPEAVLEGTLRTLDNGVRTQARALIESIARKIADANDTTATLWFNDEAANPVLMNDEKVSLFGEQSLKKTLGDANVVRMPPGMIAEDFAHFALLVPSFYYHLGVGNRAKGISAGLHTPEFDLDEDALVVGVRAMTNLAFDYLEDYR